MPPVSLKVINCDNHWDLIFNEITGDFIITLTNSKSNHKNVSSCISSFWKGARSVNTSEDKDDDFLKNLVGFQILKNRKR